MSVARSVVLLLVACRPAADEPLQPAQPSSDAPRAPASASAPASAAAPPCVSAPFPGPAPRERETMRVVPSPRPQKLGPVVCRTDREVWRDEQDRLRVCTIARPVTTFGLELAGDNYTHFRADGRPYQTTLAREQTIATAGGVAIPCAADHLVLLPDGALEHCELARAQTFERAKCGPGSIGFREDGELWHCVLAEPLDALDVTFPAGTRVSWHEGGAFASASIAEQMHVRGWLVRSEVEVHPTGGLAKITLAEPRRLGAIDVPAFAHVWFYPNGKPWHVEFTADMGTMIHGELWTDTRRVTWDCAENVTFDDTEHYQSDVRPRPPKGREP
jgi:hypothetical protein